MQDNFEVIGAEVYNTTEQEIFWYILTNNGIYTLKIDIQSFYGNLTKREGFTANLENTKDTTMCVVSRNPLLAGGSLGTYKGKYIAYLCDSSNVYYRYLYLAFDTDIIRSSYPIVTKSILSVEISAPMKTMVLWNLIK